MKRKRRLGILCLMFFSLSVLGYLYFSARIRPVLADLAKEQAIILLERAVGEASETLEIDPMELLERGYDEQGKLAILSCDTTKLNRLRSAFSERISEILHEERYTAVRVQLGTALGGDLLSGHGPEIPFRLVPVSSAVVDLEQSFQSGGINQTLFCINARVLLRAKVLLSFTENREESVCLTCPLLQMVLSGEVPESYYVS